jgi:hypothetical protein
MLLLRYFLICLIIYLLIRSFVRYNEEPGDQDNKRATDSAKKTGRKIPKEIGEYVDYEEVKDED